jgi:hypothetical protein
MKLKYKTFLNSLIKHHKKSKTNETYFKENEIPEIFNCFTVTEFNEFHFGEGKGCCSYLPPTGYKINIKYCCEELNKINSSFKMNLRIFLLDYNGTNRQYKQAAGR